MFDINKVGKVLPVQKPEHLYDPVGRGFWRFGVDQAQAALALRDLADRIDAGSVLVQTAELATRITHEDFKLRVLTIGFAERETDGEG